MGWGEGKMRLVVLSLLLCSISAAHAQIFKTYDKNGNVIFSDVPSDSAERVEEKPIAIVPALPRNVIDEKTKPLAKNPKSNAPTTYKIKLNGLEAQASLRKEQEPVKVTITTEPELHKDHQMIVSLDGKGGGNMNTILVDPSDLDRGEHNIEVKIQDQKQRVFQSQSLIFMIQQTTAVKKKK